MKFRFTDVQASWRAKGEALAHEVAADPAPGAVVQGAARVGLLDPDADLLSIAAAVEALGAISPSAGAIVAMHSVAALAGAGDSAFSTLFRGEVVGALALSSEDVPVVDDGTLTGRASWVAPVTARGVAVVGARSGGELAAFSVALDSPAVEVMPLQTAGLRQLSCAQVHFANAPCRPVGATVPVMARARVLFAALGLGIGRRALAEALVAAREAGGGASGEQTVQGLLADAATELDAAMLLTWKAACPPLSLGAASMAKLAATGAAQRAVERTTQVVGVDTFRQGHVIEQLAQDVRALELFAGRTEALRAAVAEEELPTAQRHTPAAQSAP